MADAPAKKTPKKGGKKLLGLSPWVWGGIVVGGGGIYYILRKRSEAAAAAATGTSDGGTTPASGSTSGTTTLPATLAAWFNDALGGDYTTATYSSSDLLNDLNSWLGGNCVSTAGYSVIGNLVTTLGVPPGYTTTPVLSVCSNSGTTTGTTTTTGTGTTTSTGTGTTTSTGTTTTPSVPAKVQAAIDAVAAVPSKVITKVAQGQNTTQATNNANAELPTLTQPEVTKYQATTGTSYPGPQNLGPAEEATQATANAGLLESLGYTPAQVAAMEQG